LNEKAYFFQGNSLLLPAEMPDSAINPEMPINYVENFPHSDIFSVYSITKIEKIPCVSVPIEAPLPQFIKKIPVRQALSLPLANLSDPAAALMRVFHITQWRKESVFCGSCGGKNIDSENETARLCPVCGRLEFPRITPAVIVVIQNEKDQILLAHNKKFAPGLYSLVAGFAEAGESLEAAAIREIREEVNIEISGIKYIVSQAWPFPNSLMVGFSARYASGEIKPDGIEIEEAGWFSRDNLPLLPSQGSVSRYLIDMWVDKIKN